MVVKQIQYKDQNRIFPKQKPWGIRPKSYNTGPGSGRSYEKIPTFDEVLRYKVIHKKGQSPNPEYKARRPVPKFAGDRKKKIAKRHEYNKISRRLRKYWYFYRSKSRRKAINSTSKNTKTFAKRKWGQKSYKKKTFSRKK